MKKIIIRLILVLFIVSSLSARELEIECDTPVQSWSNLTKMHAGDFSANVLFNDIKFTKNSIGYGPGKDKQYEVSILDGKIYMARPALNGATIVRHNPKKDDGAAMLQVANVNKWGEYKVLDEIDSYDSLNFELDDIVESISCTSETILPFKIVGQAKSVTWSMDTDNHRIDTMKNQDVILEGLYSRDRKTKEKHFMVKGTNTHTHVILTQKDLAGHLRDIDLKEGAKLYLPIQ